MKRVLENVLIGFVFAVSVQVFLLFVVCFIEWSIDPIINVNEYQEKLERGLFLILFILGANGATLARAVIKERKSE